MKNNIKAIKNNDTGNNPDKNKNKDNNNNLKDVKESEIKLNYKEDNASLNNASSINVGSPIKDT